MLNLFLEFEYGVRFRKARALQCKVTAININGMEEVDMKRCFSGRLLLYLYNMPMHLHILLQINIQHCVDFKGQYYHRVFIL